MLQDGLTLFSSAQAITADAASTNVLDLKHARDSGPGEPILIVINVVEAFNNLTSMIVKIQTDDNESFSSARDLDQFNLLLADLGLGRQIVMDPRQRVERYVRLYYDITGTAPTTGKVTAAIATKAPRSFHSI